MLSSQDKNIIEVVANALGVRQCWYLGGAFIFALGDGWTISVRPESAGRVRIEGCAEGAIRERMWSKTDDHDRLGEVVEEIAKLRLDAFEAQT